MCTMCLIREHLDSLRMSQRNYRLKVRTDSVIRRIVYKHSLCIRIFLDSPRHLVNLHSKRNTKLRIRLRIDINRYRSAEHECIKSAFMNISRKYNLVSCLAGGQNHGLHRRGGASYHKKSICRSKGIRRKLLRLSDYRNRMAQIVKRLH